MNTPYTDAEYGAEWCYTLAIVVLWRPASALITDRQVEIYTGSIIGNAALAAEACAHDTSSRWKCRLLSVYTKSLGAASNAFRSAHCLASRGHSTSEMLQRLREGDCRGSPNECNRTRSANVHYTTIATPQQIHADLALEHAPWWHHRCRQ